MVRIEGAGASDKGIRARNEDAFRELPDAGFFVLADGMGGYEGGQIASLVVVETLADFYARNASDRDLTWPFAIDGDLDLASNQAMVGAHMAHAAVVARKRGPLKEMGSTVAAITERVLLALAYVHAATDARGVPLGLVHRDVSPQNVLVSRGGGVWLGDFGIAKATQRADTTQANFRRGKYAYMSPEQVGKHALAASSDQFGLGVMLYEMLTGVRPYDGDSPLLTLDRIREAAPPDVRAMPTDIAAIVLRCLSREPSDRFETTESALIAVAEARRARPVVTALDLARWVVERVDGARPSDSETRPRTRPL